MKERFWMSWFRKGAVCTDEFALVCPIMPNTHIVGFSLHHLAPPIPGRVRSRRSAHAALRPHHLRDHSLGTTGSFCRRDMSACCNSNQDCRAPHGCRGHCHCRAWERFEAPPHWRTWGLRERSTGWEKPSYEKLNLREPRPPQSLPLGY